MQASSSTVNKYKINNQEQNERKCHKLALFCLILIALLLTPPPPLQAKEPIDQNNKARITRAPNIKLSSKSSENSPKNGETNERINGKKNERKIKEDIDGYGTLGTLLNKEFDGNSNSSLALVAHAGATFNFKYGFSMGLGASAAWALYSKSNKFILGFSDRKSEVYPDGGDIAQAFVSYEDYGVTLELGRFTSDALNFDYLSSNIQGATLMYEDDWQKYYLAYINSVMIDGFMPNRLASSLSTFHSYSPSLETYVDKRDGHIIIFGADVRVYGVLFAPFFLANTSIPVIKSPLFQLGMKTAYELSLSDKWKSEFILRILGQFLRTQEGKPTSFLHRYSDLSEEKVPPSFSSLLWFDSAFIYDNFLSLRLGIYGVPANAAVYTLNDGARLYGRFANYFLRDYFDAKLFSAYFNMNVRTLNDSLELDLVLAGGTYSEFTLMLDYKMFSFKKMETHLGVGYVHSIFNYADKSKYSSGHLLAYAKLHY